MNVSFLVDLVPFASPILPFSITCPHSSKRYEKCNVSYLVMSNSVIPWIVAHRAPLSMGFSRQEYWGV